MKIEPAQPDTPCSTGFKGLEEFSVALDDLGTAFDALEYVLAGVLVQDYSPRDYAVSIDEINATELTRLVNILEDRVTRVSALTAAVRL